VIPWRTELTVTGAFFAQPNWKEMLRALLDEECEREGLQIVGDVYLQRPYTQRPSGNRILCFGEAKLVGDGE
jgi:hypothetical protein